MVQKGSIRSWYDALVLQVNKRLSHGIQLLAHYTLANAEDLNQGSTTFTSSFPTAFNQFDLDDEEASPTSTSGTASSPASSGSCRLPRTTRTPFAPHVLAGWKLNGILNIQDGARVTGT